ncbi:CtsR family transcriptional regulator [Dethiothermospora halolimnae]|uniref:CtsR family transcriptional regulator n=1 Tax=Dethiothermospora halolimnae TaxID=3114390 RepID=UPI003CCBADAF
MAKVSNIIENFIKTLLKEADNGIIEIQRNELAQHFNCAPSQINYVLKTRFDCNKGYYIESKRGGGGYIKIMKVNISSDEYINNVINNMIDKSITKNQAYNIIDSFVEKGLITRREGALIKTAISDRVLCVAGSNKSQLRVNILKNMLLILLK